MLKHLGSLLLASQLFSLSPAHGEEGWGLVPLGKEAERKEAKAPVKRQAIQSRFKANRAEGEPLTLCKEGVARCVLVIPEKPSGAAGQAARLLQSTLHGITGASFPIHREGSLKEEGGELVASDGSRWPHAIWIGDTARARKLGISAAGLIPEGYRTVTKGNSLFLLGNDHGNGERELSGTRHAAVALLERHFGVRYLWPGPLGTVIPKQATLTLPPLNDQDEPALRERIIRNMALNNRVQTGFQLTGIDAGHYSKTLELSQEWRLDQRGGDSLNLFYKHAYSNWYTQYGKEHPGWFALQPDGTRTQVPERPRLCKANPEVVEASARQALKFLAEHPDAGSASISPNDGGARNSWCMCPDCRKLDPPNGAPLQLMFTIGGKRVFKDYPSLTDRVMTFYNRVAEETVKAKPDALLGAYAYSCYRDAPLAVKLHPSIVIGFVGLNYVDDSTLEADRARWNAWAGNATRLFLRPNLFHAGGALPAVYAHRMADDIRHCYETGMIAADFDSLVGHWATQGLNYYVLAKLLWDPAADVDAMIRDYCMAGFGPAAPEIETYFATLESATTRVAAEQARLREKEERELRDEEAGPRAAGVRRFTTAYGTVYTPELIGELRGHLRQAAALANGNGEVLRRIAFLELGLDYAELQLAMHRALNRGEKAVEERKQMLAWYRATYPREPLAINAIDHLFREGARYRGLK